MATDDEDDVDKEEVEADVNDVVDHTFDHLDQIIDGTSAFEADESAYRDDPLVDKFSSIMVELWHPFGGNYRVLARSTGINRRDIVTAKGQSAGVLHREGYERRALVLSIRGSLSPRNILTDLCASCEDF